MNELSDRELHTSGACGGVWAACTFCDESSARYIAEHTSKGAPSLDECPTCNHDHTQREVPGDEVRQTTPGHSDYCDCVTV
jgi:hypothetical protein